LSKVQIGPNNLISFNTDPNMIENSKSFFCRSEKSCPTKHEMRQRTRVSKREVCLKYREKRVRISYSKLAITSRFKCFKLSYEGKNILLIKKVACYWKYTWKTSNDTILKTRVHALIPEKRIRVIVKCIRGSTWNLIKKIVQGESGQHVFW